MDNRLIATNAAKWFIQRAADSGDALTNMKLQKLLYYAHGYSLVRRGVGISREPIQAWEHGPVAPEQYRMFSAFDRDPIPGAFTESRAIVSPEVESILEAVWREFGQLSAAELRRMTHREAPWRSVYVDGQRDLVISDQTMLEYFRTVPKALPPGEKPSALAALLSDLRQVRSERPIRRSRGDLTAMLEEHDELQNLRVAANARDFD